VTLCALAGTGAASSELVALTIVLKAIAAATIAAFNVDLGSLLSLRLHDNWLFLFDVANAITSNMAQAMIFATRTVAGWTTNLSFTKTFTVQLQAFGVPAIAAPGGRFLLVLVLLFEVIKELRLVLDQLGSWFCARNLLLENLDIGGRFKSIFSESIINIGFKIGEN